MSNDIFEKLLINIIFNETVKLTDDFFDSEKNICIGKNSIIETGAIIYKDNFISNNCIIATNAIIKPGCKINEHTIIGTMTNLEGNNEIGSWTTIQAQCHITKGMDIGNNVFIGPFFMSVNTPKIAEGKFGYPNTTHDERKVPLIENGVRIGGGVSISPGVIVGKNSLIDMCCLLTSNIPSNSHIRAGSNFVGRSHSNP